jgi:hypothetical protein
MRTTLTIDDDVAAMSRRALSACIKARPESLKALINEALRRGIREMSARPKRREPFRTRVVDLGPVQIGPLDKHPRSPGDRRRRRLQVITLALSARPRGPGLARRSAQRNRRCRSPLAEPARLPAAGDQSACVCAARIDGRRLTSGVRLAGLRPRMDSTTGRAPRRYRGPSAGVTGVHRNLRFGRPFGRLGH